VRNEYEFGIICSIYIKKTKLAPEARKGGQESKARSGNDY